MPSPPPHDPFSPPPLPPTEVVSIKKRARLSTGVRMVLGSSLVALVSLGSWVGLQISVQEPPDRTFTLPAIPPDPAPPAELVASPPEADPAVGESSPPKEDLRRELAESENPDASLFLRVAAAISSQGGQAEATGILRGGLARHPQDENLLIALADQLFATGTPAEAWEMVARTGRLNDSRFASRLLQFSLDAGRADETLVILDAAGDALPNWSDEDWLMLVRIHEETGQIDRAVEIADRRISDRSELFRLRSRQAGQLDEAIFNQEQYLAHLAEPSAGEWLSLSKMYGTAGRTEEAARALLQADRTGTAPAPSTPPGISSP